MRLKIAAVAFVFGFVVLISGHTLAATISDDFNDNTKDKILWGPDYRHGKGVLTEKNQRLEYAVSVTPDVEYDYSYRELIASQGTYTANWEIQIDLFNSTETSGLRYSGVGIEVGKCADWSNYIYAELYADVGGKGFYAELLTGNITSGWADTLNLSSGSSLAGLMGISFDSITKIITLYYDTGSGWVPFGSFGISAAGGGADADGDWLMTDKDQFCIDVYGWSERMTVASGKVYADNFQATGLTEPVSTRILQPNGGESIPAGELYQVAWEAPLAATKFKLQYSMDNGGSWKSMAPGLVTSRGYEWPVPITTNNKRKCLVKITGYNENGVKIGTDVSDAPFTIEVLKLNTPNGGGPPLISKNQFFITWTTNPNVLGVKRVQLSYTLDNGATWKAINTTADPSDDGSFLWKVPDVTTEKKNCKVKIVLKDAFGKTLGSDVSDTGFTIQPALQLEPYAYKAYLQWGGPLETVFTIQKPKGWKVIISGMCTTLAFLIRDPNDPLRQIFYFGLVRPVYLTQAQKDFDQAYCSVAPLYCPSWVDAPVVNPLTVENFFSYWPEIASMRNATSFMADFPWLQDIGLVSAIPQSPMLTGAETTLVRGVFTDGDPGEPKTAQGQFLASVMADPFGSGTGSGYMVFGATTPVREFKTNLNKLVESLNSFTMTEVYYNWCVAQSQEVWGAVAEIGQTLSEASDIIWNGWASRTAAQDIMAYEYDDSLRGVEKVWDPVTQKVYEFEAGWYDQYALNPELYNITTLEPMPDGRFDLWEGIILNGPGYVYLQ